MSSFPDEVNPSEIPGFLMVLPGFPALPVSAGAFPFSGQSFAHQGPPGSAIAFDFHEACHVHQMQLDLEQAANAEIVAEVTARCEAVLREEMAREPDLRKDMSADAHMAVFILKDPFAGVHNGQLHVEFHGMVFPVDVLMSFIAKLWESFGLNPVRLVSPFGGLEHEVRFSGSSFRFF